MDEGTADYFACSANNDPILGEATLSVLGAERDLTKTDKRCPEDIVGEGHADGEIIGSLGWTLREKLGAAKADQLVWGAVSLLTPGPTFGEFGTALGATADALATAGDLTAADVDAVKQAVAARGLDDCEQVLSLDGGKSRSVSVVGLSLLGQFFGGSCAQLQGFGLQMQSLFHFSKSTTATDKGVALHVDIQQSDPGPLEYTVHVRADLPVTFKQGMALPVPDKFDAKFALTAATGDVVIDATTMPAFQPGKTYYFAITHASCPNIALTITADTTTMDPATTASSSSASTGAGGAGGQGGGGGKTVKEIDGCGCSVVGADSSATPLAFAGAFVGLGLAAARRRRRRAAGAR